MPPEVVEETQGRFGIAREESWKNEAPIDRRFTRGKCVEAKQKADKLAASKLDGKPGDVKDVAVTYDGEVGRMFENADVALDVTDRILLSGVNGVGNRLFAN